MRHDDQPTEEGDGLEARVRMDTARRQNLDEQSDCREQLHVGIEHTEIDEHRSCLTIDPAEITKAGDIAV